MPNNSGVSGIEGGDGGLNVLQEAEGDGKLTPVEVVGAICVFNPKTFEGDLPVVQLLVEIVNGEPSV